MRGSDSGCVLASRLVSCRTCLEPRLLLAVFCLGLTAFLLCPGCRSKDPPASAAPEVMVTEALQEDVPIVTEWVGTLDGYINAQIRARVQGYLEARSYKEGSLVRTGDILFVIDPRPYQAALAQASAQLSQAEADLGKTKLDVARYSPLAAEGAVSQEELDNAVQSNQANAAAVEAARAAVEIAQLNLDWTQIRCPIDGVAGLATAQIGDLIGQNSAMTTVSQLDPIKAVFPISEAEYLKFAARRIARHGQGDEHADELTLVLGDGTIYPRQGGFLHADRQVDVKTGTITVEAVFPNPDHLLRPGQYARVRGVTDTVRGAVVVPQRAVQELLGTSQVAVVGADNKVELRAVSPGIRTGSLWVLDQGVKPGEHVIVEGLQKVKAGMVVRPKPAPAAPEDSPAAGETAATTAFDSGI
jgi:RND family efflux transporter MFP subunit